MEDGDLVVMHDTGGYTYALYSRFNSIQAPAIYGYETNEDGSYTFIQYIGESRIFLNLKRAALDLSKHVLKSR